ncbi:MAG: hypothetical protein IJV77_06585 [Clostridia bacterium]|nr:hypothetical protein [Clostridia bacterium]
MTVVVAVRQGNTVFMGADTQSTFDPFKENYLSEQNLKIRKMPNDVLVAESGRSSVTQEMVFRPEFFENIPKDTGLTKKYIVQEIIPKYKKILKKADALDEKGKGEFSFLFVWKDRIFKVHDDFCVSKINNYVSIGSGSDLAYPFLDDTKLSMQERLMSGMKMAEKFDQAVSGPFVFIDTKDMQYKIVH